MQGISHCPKCYALVMLPVAAEPDAYVRCPVCESQFLLIDALRNAPPTLEVLDDPHSGTPSLAANQPGPLTHSDPSEFAMIGEREEFQLELHPPVRELQDAPFVVGTELASPPEPGRAEFSPADALMTDALPRDAIPRPNIAPMLSSRKKRPPSPLWQFAGVVGGGVLGIAVGYFALLWVGGPQKDFLNLGERLPTYLLPPDYYASRHLARQAAQNRASSESLREPGHDTTDPKVVPQAPSSPAPQASTPEQPTRLPPVDDADRSDEPMKPKPDTDSQHEPPGSPPTDGDGLTADKKPMDSPSASDAAVAIADPPGAISEEQAEVASDPDGSEEIDRTSVPISRPLAHQEAPRTHRAAPSTVDPDPTTSAETAAVVDRPLKANATDPPTGDRIGPRSAPEVEVSKLQKTLQAAMFAQSGLVEGDLKDRKYMSTKGRSYMTLCRLAEAYTYVAMAGKQEHQPYEIAVRTLVLGAVKASKGWEEIGTIGGRWLNSQKRQGDGAVVAGTVTSIESAGSLFVIVLEFSGSQGSIALLRPQEPSFEVGHRLVAMGVVVEDPHAHVAGYQGDLKMAIWPELIIEAP